MLGSIFYLIFSNIIFYNYSERASTYLASLWSDKKELIFLLALVFSWLIIFSASFSPILTFYYLGRALISILTLYPKPCNRAPFRSDSSLPNLKSFVKAYKCRSPIVLFMPSLSRTYKDLYWPRSNLKPVINSNYSIGTEKLLIFRSLSIIF